MLPVPGPAIHQLSPINQSRVRSINHCTPKTIPMIPPRPMKVRFTKQQIKQFKSIRKQFINGSITLEEAILQIRGGDGWSDLVAVITYIMFMEWFQWYFGAEAFPQTPLPHMDPVGWRSGKYTQKPGQSPLSTRQSRFDRDFKYGVERLCVAQADEEGYIMSYQQAKNLIKETYPGAVEGNETFKISDRQAASHLYHGNGVGVNPADYGMTQAELDKIRNGGLIEYVRRGNRLPSPEHVKAYQNSLKKICLDPLTAMRDDSKYYYKHGVTPATVYRNDRILICFNQTSRDLITGDKQRLGTVNKYLKTNELGAQKWIAKWKK